MVEKSGVVDSIEFAASRIDHTFRDVVKAGRGNTRPESFSPAHNGRGFGCMDYLCSITEHIRMGSERLTSAGGYFPDRTAGLVQPDAPIIETLVPRCTDRNEGEALGKPSNPKRPSGECSRENRDLTLRDHV